MLNGEYKGVCVGTGTVIWETRRQLARGEIDYPEFIKRVACSAPSAGHCNAMGTALTMNVLAESIGFMLPGTASIPAPDRERQQAAYYTGKRIVEMVWEDLTPSRILSQVSLENAMITCAAIGGSTNAPIHIAAIARHAGIEHDIRDWDRVAHRVPLLVNCQPTGHYLSEEFHKAGVAPAVHYELQQSGFLRPAALTVNGKSISENCADRKTSNRDVIRSAASPLRENGGFMILSGNLFESAVMNTSAISDSFRRRYLGNADDPNAFVGTAFVFEGPEDYHHCIEDERNPIDENSILVMRGTGPRGYPGSAEVVNMQPPARLFKAGIEELPTMGDGRQSGTSGAPSILNISPEAAAGGGLAYLQTGDAIRIDLNQRQVNHLVPQEEWERRISHGTMWFVIMAYYRTNC